MLTDVQTEVVFARSLGRRGRRGSVGTLKPCAARGCSGCRYRLLRTAVEGGWVSGRVCREVCVRLRMSCSSHGAWSGKADQYNPTDVVGVKHGTVYPSKNYH